MNNRDVLTKIMAIAGILLVWFPLLAPIVLAIFSLVDGRLRFDYLIPAELFPSTLLGGASLLWAALRSHSQQKLIGWGLAIAAVTLFGSQLLAVTSGLAYGEIGQGTIWRVVVLALLFTYSIAMLVVGVGGILMLRKLFTKP